jgi:glycogen operon protein
MQKEHWHSHHAATLGYLLQEKAPDSPALLCLFHAGEEQIEFQLPDIDTIDHWQVFIDTTASDTTASGTTNSVEQSELRSIPADRIITMAPFSTIVLLND